MSQMLRQLNRLLSVEEEAVIELRNTGIAKELDAIRAALHETVRQADSSGDLALIVATERAILESDLKRYANSSGMVNSLKTSLHEISVIERHIGIVDDKTKYRIVDQAHSLPKNRKKGLPYDEARQALSSHYARLNNLDKARLSGEEKKSSTHGKQPFFPPANCIATGRQKPWGLRRPKITAEAGNSKHPLPARKNDENSPYLPAHRHT